MTAGRFEKYGAGRDIVAGDVTLSSGWGTSPTLSITSGSNDQAGRVAVTAKATPGANPTITITFSSPFEETPVAVASQSSSSDTTLGVAVVVSVSTTALVLKVIDTPQADEVYTYSYFVIG